MFAFLFFHDEWLLMKTIEKHAYEFNKVQFYHNGCMGIGHKRLKHIFLVLWIHKDKPLSFSVHKKNSDCILSDYQNRRAREIAEQIFINVWKEYMLGEDYLLDKDEIEGYEKKS